MTFGHVRPSKPVWGRTKAEGFRLSFPIVSELLWVRHNIGLAGSLKTVSKMTLSGWRQRGMGVAVGGRWLTREPQGGGELITRPSAVSCTEGGSP